MIQTKTTARIQPWSLNLRNKVGDSVSHNGFTWVNVSGRNSEPNIPSPDWEPVYNSMVILDTLEVKIGDYWFDTSGNVNKNSIEVGNTFRGWNGVNYVVGRVVGLPFDINDSTKVSLAINNEI